MSPTAKPARETLKLAGQTTIAWAVFDPAWYLAAHPAARDELGEADDAAVLAYYFEKGQQQGHSPNLWFDEDWHLRQYPGAAASVREGHAQSGFDAYCRAGFRMRSPHWLFNELGYRQRCRDLTDDVLAKDGNANGYDHYLKHGAREERAGHFMFDPAIYRAQLDKMELAEAEALGPFRHYLRHISVGGSERRTSVFFDPLWYLHRYPAVADAVAERKWLSALHHYLSNDTPSEFDPVAEFSEKFYLSRYPDVVKAIESRNRRNGYEHFVTNGAGELRSPSQWIDLRYYVNAHPTVRADLELGRARDAFAHFLGIGRAQGLAPVPPPEEQVTQQQANALFRRKAADYMPTAGRVRADFTCTTAPDVSVVMVLRGGLAETLLALGRLRANFTGAIELILVDSSADSAMQELNRYALGAIRLPFDVDIGIVRAYNAALQCASADAVLFLSNDVELAPGTVAAALRAFSADEHIGVVGAKVILGHARLLQAGGIVWRDGVIQDYLNDGSPIAPEANFVRDVDCCSVACMLVRGPAARDVDGFDEELEVTPFVAADLCLRMASAGHRVVYDPSVVVHFHGNEAGVLNDASADRAQQRFFRKHMNHLRFLYIANRRVEVFARSSSSPRRVLFIDDTIPLRHIGSGFVRSNDIIHALASLGFGVTVYPLTASRSDLIAIYADMPPTVEVMHDRTMNDLAEFLAAREGYYEAVWIARTHNLDRVRTVLERTTSGWGRPPLVVLDTEAIASMRQAERAALLDKGPFDLDAAILSEFANAHFCQSIVAVNATEARKLRELGFADVAIIGHRRDVQPTPRAYSDRAGLLFVGAIHETDSPNYDGLVWFIGEVLPLIERELGWETRLTVVGYADPSVSLSQFRENPRVTLRGTVMDTERLYDTHRVFVAPTRYAAGMPYKLHEAASFGIPIVATDLLRRQLGWENGRDLLSADAKDPAAFAAQIVTLYRDALLWQTLRDNALQRIRAENDSTDYDAALDRVLATDRVLKFPGAI